jgi:hypothetical protein
MRILNKRNNNITNFAYTSLVRPILEYGAACWDPFWEGQINASDREHEKAAKFANLTNESNWEKLAQRRKIAGMCALYKAYSGEPGWKAISERLQRPYYVRWVDHDWKIRNRRQRTDNGKYSFVTRTIQLWIKLPMNTLGTFPPFRKRIRKVISEVK